MTFGGVLTLTHISVVLGVNQCGTVNSVSGACRSPEGWTS